MKLQGNVRGAIYPVTQEEYIPKPKPKKRLKVIAPPTNATTGICQNCGAYLPKNKKKFCNDKCIREYRKQYHRKYYLARKAKKGAMNV